MVAEWDSRDAMMESSERRGDAFQADAGTEALEWERPASGTGWPEGRAASPERPVEEGTHEEGDGGGGPGDAGMGRSVARAVRAPPGERREIPSPATEAIGKAAKQAKAYVSMGVNERERNGGTLSDTQITFGRDGKVIGKHRKLMPTAGERLVWGMGDGSTLEVYDTPFGRLGGRCSAAPTCPTTSRAVSCGAPSGDLLAGPLVEEEGILYAELDAGTARQSRHEFDPVGRYARPDVFRLQVDTEAKPATTG